MVSFEDDFTVVVIGDSRFVAITGTDPGSCQGCVFKVGFGCVLTQKAIKAGAPINPPYLHSRCDSESRPDRRDIIWRPR